MLSDILQSMINVVRIKPRLLSFIKVEYKGVFGAAWRIFEFEEVTFDVVDQIRG